MPEKVLIVDDEHDIADLIEVYLQNENYTVYKFYSSKEALVCIESEEVDLAILDTQSSNTFLLPVREHQPHQRYAVTYRTEKQNDFLLY